MQFGQVQNQLLLEQQSANNNSQFDQKIERRRFSLLNADKSQSCSPVKKQKKKDAKEEKIDLDFVDENTLNAITSNLKLFYELEIEQYSITYNQQIMNLKTQIQKKETQENNLVSEIKRIKLKYDQLLIDHEIQVKELNHKYKYQLELFKCQVEQQINEYSSQIADVMSKNAELLDILSADHSICQKYTRLFKNYKNGQTYQEVITKNISLTNEIRMMKIEQQIIQQDNSNYIQHLSKLNNKVNLYQKLNEERQQELIEKDQIIQLHQKQNEQMQSQYQTLLHEFSAKVLSLIKQKDILQDQITQRLQKQLNESENQKKEFVNNNELLEKNIQYLSNQIKEYKKQNLGLSQKIYSLEQKIKHEIENSTLKIETMRNDTAKLIKLHEKNNITKNDQHNMQIQNQKQYYEKQVTDWKNNYYKVSQKLCELEQNITNGPKYYLQKAYEDYQQNVQRTVEATEHKIQEIMQQNLKLQNAVNLQSNENQALKDQVIELKESNQNYLDMVHNFQKESLQYQEKAQIMSLMYEENKQELIEIKQRLQKEQELRQIIEKEQCESQLKLEQQIQNLKREIISITQSNKNQNHMQDQLNQSLKVEKISLNTSKHFNISNQIQNQQNQLLSGQKTQYNNSSIFNTIGLEINQDQSIEQLFEQSQQFNMQNKTQLKQSHVQNTKNANNFISYDFWQMQSFCSRMMSDFQANFEKTLSAIKDNIDKQYHNSFFKEIRLTIEKDSRVLDLPFEEKKQFTLKATEYFALVLDSRMKELKIQILINQISNLMNTELKEKVNLQTQLEKALKENVALQKANQNRIGNESEDFKNILQNQINRLFQNLKDLDSQKLQQIEVKQIEQAIKKELSTQYETKLNMELEENKRFVSNMKQEYNNLLRMHEERVSDITIKLGSEIAFLHSQLEKKIQAAVTFNSSGKIENLNQSLFPQSQVQNQEQSSSPKQRDMPLTTTQNFLKNCTYSNNKENNKRNSLNSENGMRQNTLIQTMSVLNQSIPYQIVLKAANQSENLDKNKQRQSLRFGGRQITVSQHLNTTGEISTLPSSNQYYMKNNLHSQSLEHGIDINCSPQYSSSNSKEKELFSKPSLSYSFENNKEIQLPTSIKSELQNKKFNTKKYLNQSVDILEGIREEKQNRLNDFLNSDILDVSSKENKSNTFNDHELRKTYQHFVLPSKSVEPTLSRAAQSGLGTKKNFLNSTISVLKDTQFSSKSQNNKKIMRLGQKNTLQGMSPAQQNINNKGQIQQNFKHFSNQNNLSRQKFKLSQLALISNESINIQMQLSNSNQGFNTNTYNSINKQ
ncbi:hypothetical protein TTHERM_00238890 (macronuclear) [Tetrahymena thermophila SB210]|uniref:Uncharacterized protein n=1 Tax=Tetrahymena thermophila (strain SB210) TaxID=312017 RepID=I7M3Y9_TETTS|nr:hypothetical protein TTHERM_00238890 [Tetrahymena thermophila SB210]EAS04569.2 hypothetical protein TTHERM_00238890 [Tetrahymena thermophila SB210]|eukprot:XP_001024814.2 hypothetical protein TTHERM_00238890 [Tetrahymena thermophila SB210]